MEYKKYEYPSFNIYTVKTNRFKSCQMQIIFQDEVKKENLLAKTFLADIMSDCSANYPSRKYISKKLEELYQATFYGNTNKVGNMMLTTFVLSFLNPKFINDKNYLEEVIKLPFEFILNPFINAEEFDIKNFNIVKNRLKDEILSLNENINKKALKGALSKLKESATTYSVLGSLEELEAITPKILAKTYEELMTTNKCDIFIAGNLDMDEIANLIFKYFKKAVINTRDLKLYVDNKPVNKLQKYKEQSSFLETNLINIYNLIDLTDKEKLNIFPFFNYLLGSGGLNTKLYQLLREKNSLCYAIRSMYLKYDNLLIIQTSINAKDIAKAQKLIKIAFREMSEGKITNEEIEYAKSSFIFSLNLALDSIGGILSNYIFHVLTNLPLIEERIKSIQDIKKEEIMNISKKIKPNMVYVLEGKDKNGEN